MNKHRWLYYVYDRRTTMDDYAASFKSETDAQKWASEKFGEFAHVTTRDLRIR